MTDLFRWVVVAELATLIACGTAWHTAYRSLIPSPAWRVGWGFGYVLAMVGLAVLVNLATDQPVTNGLRVLSFAVAPAVAWVLGCTIIAVRAESTSRQAVSVAEVLGIINAVEGHSPCTDPDCIAARVALRRLTGRPDPT